MFFFSLFLYLTVLCSYSVWCLVSSFDQHRNQPAYRGVSFSQIRITPVYPTLIPIMRECVCMSVYTWVTFHVRFTSYIRYFLWHFYIHTPPVRPCFLEHGSFFHPLECDLAIFDGVVFFCPPHPFLNVSKMNTFPLMVVGGNLSSRSVRHLSPSSDLITNEESVSELNSESFTLDPARTGMFA